MDVERKKVLSAAQIAQRKTAIAARWGNRSLQDRFWDKVRKSENGCWEWQAYRKPEGYGKFMVGRRPYLAHRLSFLWANGFEGDVVCHKCDNPPCVRPDHLYSGTQKDNLRDARERGRAFAPKTHCVRGHSLVQKNVYTPPKGGGRECRVCRSDRQKERRSKSVRDARVASGLCSGCGLRLDTCGRTCSACRARVEKSRRAHRS